MPTKIQKTLRSAALCLLLSVGAIHLAWAVIATYQQIVDAVRNSPNSNAFLIANAASVANCALKIGLVTRPITTDLVALAFCK